MKMFARVSCLVLLAAVGQANGAVLVPNSIDAPFEDWSRGYDDSTYAEWDAFTSAFGAPNSPDVGEVENAAATLQQTSFGAIITSTNNIYSPAGPSAFDVNIPGLGLGAGTTRVVAQIVLSAFGTELDTDSVLLTPAAGSAAVPTYTVAGAGAGVLEYLFAWDVPGNDSSYQLQFAAGGAHMSLDRVVVDTYTQADAFTAFPTNVPEPATAALAALGLLTAVGVRRRATQG